MSNGRQPAPTVEVVEPIKVRTIEWRRSADPPVAVAVNLTYHFRDRNSKIKVAGQAVVADVRGGRFGINPALALADHPKSDLLVSFLALGIPAYVAKALRDLGGDPEQSPVVLRTGLLASLLQYGITPEETWTFLINHGAARRKGMALLNPLAPMPADRLRVRTHDPWAADANEKLLETVILRCSQAARLLRRLQTVNMSAALVSLGFAKSVDPSDAENPQPIAAGAAARIGPLPVLPPEPTQRMIAELEHIASNSKKYLLIVRQPRHRKAHPDAPRFCRDWYKLATERTRNPLYEHGRALYSLLFGKITEASFKKVSRRARQKGTEVTKKD